MKNVQNALSIFNQENSLVKYAINATSLVMPDGADFTTVEKMLSGMKVLGDATKFWRGDLLVYAYRNFGEMYSQLVDASDMAYSSLKDEMWVSTNVSPTVRKEELSWQHHREVASLPKDEQERFLSIAVEKRLSSVQLRTLIRADLKKEPSIPKADAYCSALKAILHSALESEYFNEKFFHERLEDNEKIDRAALDITKMAIIAKDALDAYEKKGK